jgi:aldehyde:ferredoxin oxidoreductase
MLFGYAGKHLFVDLSTGRITEETPDECMLRDYLGGAGVGARILFSRQKGGVDALGPENTFGLITGPFTGTAVPYSGRWQAVAKSPLTGCWGDANCGGKFGANLKFAGYDAVFFTGQSDKPVYLFINDGKAELRDAAGIWGLDTFQTEDKLRELLGSDVHVACIGQGGEKLSRIAAVMTDKGRAAARSGMGAVMGSKKLKAVAVRGKSRIQVKDPEGLNELRKRAIEAGKADPVTGKLFNMHSKWGNVGLVRSWIRQGAMPTKNYGGCDQIDFPDVDEYLGASKIVAWQERKDGCWGCPCLCGGRLRANTGEYSWEAGAHKPEFESLSFGIKTQNRSLESVLKCCDLTNRAGLDHCSAGAVVAFAIECFENGLLTTKDTGGLELTWGNSRAIVKLTELICKREGIGDILADGTRIASAKIGKGADQYSIDVCGQEIDNSDPRPWPGWGAGYVFDATPGRHTVGSTYFAESPPAPPKGLGLGSKPLPAHVYAGKGEANRRLNALHNIQNCTGICQFSAYHGVIHGENLPDFFRTVMGWQLTVDDLFEIGDRIATIRMAFTLREGINPAEHFRLHPRIIGPIKSGPHRNVIIDINTMVRDYCQAMDWDPSTFLPSRRRLVALGMSDVAEALGIPGI